MSRKGVIKAAQEDPRFHRQATLGVYGDGPIDEDVGHPCGNQDVAVLRLLPGFVVVRTEYLDALEGLVNSQGERLAQLEKAK